VTGTDPSSPTHEVRPAQPAQRVADAVARLRGAGERVTPARRAVLAVVDAADARGEHLTADQIGSRVADLEPAVHRATVYRTLTSLTELGALSHVHLGGSATVYHLAAGPGVPDAGAAVDDAPGRHDHAHVQCHACGRVLDVPPDVLDDVARRLEADLGFELDTSHAALLGTCRECRRA
jgi:Fur family ferric uptake transcriptional regulator